MKQIKTGLSFLLLILFPFLSFTQNIKLSGEVYGYTVRQATGKDKKLYYTFDENPFSAQKFIKYSKDYTYEWELALKEIKNENIKQVTFSTDPAINLQDQHACLHKIRLDRILESKRFRDQKNIQIDCDILLDFNCESTPYYGAKEEDLVRFIGTYAMTRENETYGIVLRDFAFRFVSSPTKGNTINLLPEEFGSWSFDPSSKTLILNVYLIRKKYFGLMKKTKYQYTFDVIENEDKILFKSDKFQFKKLH